MNDCAVCKDTGEVSYNPSPVHAHIFARMPCPTCRVVVSKEEYDRLVKLRDLVIASSREVPEWATKLARSSV